MTGIDVKRFVDINIKQHIETQISGTRGTLVLFTSEGTASSTHKTFNSLSDVNALAAAYAATKEYLRVYFSNGGASAMLIEAVPINEFTMARVEALDNRYIMIGLCAPEENIEAAYAQIKSVATAYSSKYGIEEKIFFARTHAAIGDATIDTSLVKNLAVKWSGVHGAEMTMAAYLSRINVYGVSTVHDYMYTAETSGDATEDIAENITDAEYALLALNNFNVDTYLAGAVRNLGGNLKDGSDMVNGFVRIIMHQTLTDRLLNLLVTKLKNADGIGKIHGAISNELDNYRTCGYLTTDKVWTDETMMITVNDRRYTIIENGSPLIDGYVVKVLPLDSLTEADKAAKKAPAIYVVIADQYGIRAVTVNGEII